jgi:hypothetical protein
MTSQPGTRAARSRPAGSCPPPADPSQHDECRDNNGHRAHDHDTGLDDYIRDLVDEAPPLTREQRHTIALLLRNPVPARPAEAAPWTQDTPLTT